MKVCIPNSSNVRRIGHYFDTSKGEAQEGTLLTCLKGGDYAYLGVPEQVFQDFCAAESAGKFLNSQIKDKYQYRPMTEAECHMMATAEPMAPPSAASQHKVEPMPHSTNPMDRMALAGLDHADMPNLIFPYLNNWPSVVDVKVLDPNIAIKYAKPGDAAFDLMASHVMHPTLDMELDFPVTVEPGKHVLVGTGISMRLGVGLAGLVLPRSGSAKKQRISVVNSPGLIDGKYTGEIGVLFENRGDKPVKIKQYDRIAQYMIVPVITPIFRMVDDLGTTERGSGGFGSTGTEKVVV